VSSNADALRRFVIDLSTGYANLCDHVIAPSQSVATLLRERGVVSPITVVPTGVDLTRFARRSPKRFRQAQGIPLDALVVGHCGRLAPEKNLMFLTRSIAAFLRARPEAWFLVAGVGPIEEEMRVYLQSQGVLDRCRFAGILQGSDLIDCYASMDVFAFASQSETQGLVLVEAMAAGVPVIAVDASGVREVVQDGVNGRMLPIEDETMFATALDWYAGLSADSRKTFSRAARRSARRVSKEESANKLSAVYSGAVRRKAGWEPQEDDLWHSAMRRIQAEWRLFGAMAHAAGTALVGAETEGGRPA
jgi:glycosyltransferase involved in cell wall biosynthesis